jgi:hypothetical protein
VPPQLSVQDRRVVAEAMVTFQALQALDHAWTTAAERAGGVPQSEHGELRQIVEGLQTQLDRSQRHSQLLLRVVRENGPALQQAYEEAIQSSTVTSEQKSWLEKKVAEHGGLAAFAIQSLEGIAEAVPSEKEGLAAKLNQILGARSSSGDLTKSFMCKVAAGCVVAGLAGGQPEFFGFGIGVAIVLGC